MLSNGWYNVTTDRNDVYEAAKFWKRMTLAISIIENIILKE